MLIHHTILELIQADITTLDVDVIVNAANNSLLGGGGVDGAIHRAAGPQLLEECRTLNGCETGQAKMTKGYKLKARHVIHTVGPIYDGSERVAALLASAHRRSLEVAVENKLQTLAFPAISTGVYGYPLQEAAPIALAAVCDFAKKQNQIRLVRFVLFNQPALNAFESALATLVRQREDLQYG